MRKQPLHTFMDQYLPVPDMPWRSMIDFESLPEDAQEALTIIRQYDTADSPLVGVVSLSMPVREWFWYGERVA